MSLSRVLRNTLLVAAMLAPAAVASAADYVALVLQADSTYHVSYARSIAGTVTVDSAGKKVPLKGYDDKVTVKGPGIAYIRCAPGDAGTMTVYFRITDSANNEAVIKVESPRAGAKWTLTNSDNVPNIVLDQDQCRVVLGKPKFK